MSLTQERINEIAKGCYRDHLDPTGVSVVDMFNLFLSRIREEQKKPDFYLNPDTGRAEDWQDTGWLPCYIHIPSVAPDCNQIISAFSGDEVPSFRQGAPSHELEYVVTSEDCSRWVNELVGLRAAYKELAEALKKIANESLSQHDGDANWLQLIAQEALAKHKAAQKIASSL